MSKNKKHLRLQQDDLLKKTSRLLFLHWYRLISSILLTIRRLVLTFLKKICVNAMILTNSCINVYKNYRGSQ